MNCRRAQYLLSPYVDQRLTGQQMLEVRDHLDGCPTCSEEYLVIRQVKTLLRSMAMKNPGRSFEERIQARVASDRLQSVLSMQIPAIPLVNRGRRLAYALALSCVGILSVTAQLGTAENSKRSYVASRSGGFPLFVWQGSAPTMASFQIVPASSSPTAVMPVPVRPDVFWTVKRQQTPPAAVQPPDFWNLRPFNSAGGSSAGNVSFADYYSR